MQIVRRRIDSLLSNPKLIVVFLILFSILLFASIRKFSPKPLPDLPGFSWSKHPKILLINYIDGGCGCLEILSPKISLATKYKYKILIIKDHSDKIEDIHTVNISIYDRNLIRNFNQTLFAHSKETSYAFVSQERVVDESDLPEMKSFSEGSSNHE